jgi:hypothetical protein
MISHRDPVTPEIRLAVLARDGSCIAPLVGGSAHDCWGRSTIEHVKDQLRMGRRAPSDLGHLVSLCQGHTEDGRRAGFQWNTAKANRAAIRAYLERIEDPHAAHVDPCSPTCRGGSR